MLIPKELSLFDTILLLFLFLAKTLGTLLKEIPIWDRNLMFLCVSKCQAHTERIVVVGIAIVVVRIEHSCIAAIIVIAATVEERIARIHEARVVTE